MFEYISLHYNNNMVIGTNVVEDMDVVDYYENNPYKIYINILIKKSIKINFQFFI